MLERIPDRLTVSIERETFPRMLEEPGRLYAMASDAYWLDIGTPEKYLQAHADVLRGALGRPPAPGARELTPGVWVQGTPTIDADAVLEAPALIGDGAVVAAGARVAGSVVGAGAWSGPARASLRSVLHAGAVLADGRRGDRLGRRRRRRARRRRDRVRPHDRGRGRVARCRRTRVGRARPATRARTARRRGLSDAGAW